MKITFYLIITILISAPLQAHEDDHHHELEPENHSNDAPQNEHKHHEHGEYTTTINMDLAEKLRITTSKASSRTLNQKISVYGQLSIGPEQLSHVRARFEGLIQSVAVSIGDKVNTGDLLAEVESNESLKIYKVKAPISGMITQRHANTGEVTKDQVLFSIANLDSIWAEFRIFPAQVKSIKAGQELLIADGDKTIKAQIEHIIPALDKPYLYARAKIARSQISFPPGAMVEAKVLTNRFTVDLAVEKKAVHTMDGKSGVFLKNNNRYSFAALKLGASDEQYWEVLDGLNAGDEYVTGNSFLIKADIEKSEAEHVH